MTEITSSPSRAYDLLEQYERQAVDDYVNYAIAQAHHKRVRIAHYLSIVIPTEIVRRSKGVLAKPIARAAVAEKLQEAANAEDLSPDRVIKEHASIAFSNLSDYIIVQPFGDFSIKSLDTIPRHLMAAVKTIRSVPSPYGNRVEIVMHDKHPSLKVLTELMGLVAPDKTPVLQDYARPPQSKEIIDAVPETAYVKLIEQSQHTRV